MMTPILAALSVCVHVTASVCLPGLCVMHTTRATVATGGGDDSASKPLSWLDLLA